MIDYLEIKSGRVTKGTGSGYTLPKGKNILFLFVQKPSEKDNKKILQDFKLNESIFKNAARSPYASRISMKPYSFIMMDYFYENHEIKNSRLLFISKHNVLIIISNIEAEYYKKLFQDTYEEVRKSDAKSIGHIFHGFLQEDVEDNYEALEYTENLVNDIETAVLKKDVDQINVEKIMKLKRKLFRMSRQFWASTKIISAIRGGLANIKIDADSRRLLGEIHDTFLHQIDVANSQKEILSDALTIYSTAVSNKLTNVGNNLNFVMKRLAALAIIIMIPTLISGVYGMNVINLPLAQQQTGFLLILGIMFITVLPIAYLFYRKDWL